MLQQKKKCGHYVGQGVSLKSEANGGHLYSYELPSRLKGSVVVRSHFPDYDVIIYILLTDESQLFQIPNPWCSLILPVCYEYL